MRRGALLTLVIGIGFSGAVAAETAYVTDSLRLGLHAASDTSDRPFETLLSGTAVEVLERTTNYARVKLGDGREGWVKAAYLVTEKPAALRVVELESEIETLEGAVAEAKTSQATAQHELARLTAELTGKAGAAETIQETIERLEAENRAYQERVEKYRYMLPLMWVMPALVVTLVAGFLAGLWWLDALIRRRHGGFRVY